MGQCCRMCSGVWGPLHGYVIALKIIFMMAMLWLSGSLHARQCCRMCTGVWGPLYGYVMALKMKRSIYHGHILALRALCVGQCCRMYSGVWGPLHGYVIALKMKYLFMMAMFWLSGSLHVGLCCSVSSGVCGPVHGYVWHLRALSTVGHCVCSGVCGRLGSTGKGQCFFYILWTRENKVHIFGIGCLQQSDTRTDGYMQHDDDGNLARCNVRGSSVFRSLLPRGHGVWKLYKARSPRAQCQRIVLRSFLPGIQENLVWKLQTPSPRVWKLMNTIL